MRLRRQLARCGDQRVAVVAFYCPGGDSRPVIIIDRRDQPRMPTLRACAGLSEILDVVLDHIEEEASENGEPTADDERWASELHAKMRARIAELRRQLTTPEG
jgi:hypothetical protein